MNNQEALEMLTSHQAWAKSESPRYAEAVEVAIESLEKQVPKKPKDNNKNPHYPNLHSWVCPVCGEDIEIGYEVIDIEANFCFSCGQAIDWSEE